MADVAPSPPSTAPHSAPSVARSPSDVLRLAVAAALLLVLLLLQWLAGDALIAFAEELLRGLDALPDWIVDVVFIATRVLGTVVLVGALVMAIRGGGLRMLGTAVVAALVALGLVALLEQFDPDDGSTALDVGTPLGPLLSAGFPSAGGLAAITAALTASAPWLSPAGAPDQLGLHRGSLDHPLRGYADVVRHAPSVAVRLGRRRGSARRPRWSDAAPDDRGRDRRPRSGRSPAGQPGAGQRRRPRVDPVLRSGRERRAAVRQGPRRGPSAAPTCSSGSTGRCSAGTWATSDRFSSLRRSGRARGAAWRWPHATSASAPPGCGPFATAEPNALRPRLRGSRRAGPSTGSRPAR